MSMRRRGDLKWAMKGKSGRLIEPDFAEQAGGRSDPGIGFAASICLEWSDKSFGNL